MNKGVKALIITSSILLVIGGAVGGLAVAISHKHRVSESQWKDAFNLLLKGEEDRSFGYDVETHNNAGDDINYNFVIVKNIEYLGISKNGSMYSPHYMKHEDNNLYYKENNEDEWKMVTDGRKLFTLDEQYFPLSKITTYKDKFNDFKFNMFKNSVYYKKDDPTLTFKFTDEKKLNNMIKYTSNNNIEYKVTFDFNIINS